MNREFIEAIDELAQEKEVSTEVILEAIEAALKDYEENGKEK